MSQPILCLANSYKHEHRCVAGIDLARMEWVRLVGHTVPGCITVREASYADGRPLQLLDVFETNLGESCASNAHPEDRFLGKGPIRFVRRFDRPGDAKVLLQFASKGPAVLQSYGDRVYQKKFSTTKVAGSIEIIKPEDLWWWIRHDGGKRRNRALFRAGSATRVRYDLAVTDPEWLEKLKELDPGIYPHASLEPEKHSHPLLTVSLSEPFEGFHYKLVAGVF